MELNEISNIVLSGGMVKVITAIVILLLGILVARFLSKLIKRVLSELRTDKILREEVGIKIPVGDFLSRIVKYLVYFITIIFALNQLGLTVTVLYIILIIILIIIIILIVLAFKDFMPNLTAGLFNYQKRNFKVNDEIEIKGIRGKIIDMNLIEVKIKTKDNDELIIPNVVFLKEEIKKLK